MRSREVAQNCVNLHAKYGENCSLTSALAWQNLFAPLGRKAAGASKALPCRILRVFEYFSPNRVYVNSRNFTRNCAISRVPARRYAISWVRARFALLHTISRKCNQRFWSGSSTPILSQLVPIHHSHSLSISASFLSRFVTNASLSSVFETSGLGCE